MAEQVLVTVKDMARVTPQADIHKCRINQLAATIRMEAHRSGMVDASKNIYLYISKQKHISSSELPKNCYSNFMTLELKGLKQQKMPKKC